VSGLLAAAAGVAIVTLLTPQSPHVLPLYLAPALVLTGLGLGCVMSPTASLATAGVPPQDIGAASASYNAAQQLGAALGTAMFNTVATSTAAAHMATATRAAAYVHGYTTALTVGAGVLVVTACLTAVLVTVRTTVHREMEKDAS
jgi:MFS family permease